jgi:hypothetical protein
MPYLAQLLNLDPLKYFIWPQVLFMAPTSAPAPQVLHLAQLLYLTQVLYLTPKYFVWLQVLFMAPSAAPGSQVHAAPSPTCCTHGPQGPYLAQMLCLAQVLHQAPSDKPGPPVMDLALSAVLGPNYCTWSLVLRMSPNIVPGS